jgi:hypothetical protein
MMTRQAAVTARGAIACAAAGALFGLACHTDMFEQPKLRPLEESEFFADGSSARPVPDDTVPHAPPDADLLTAPVTRALLERGRERYDIFCAPCHGVTGDGEGPIVRRGFKAPLSLHSDTMRALPATRLMASMVKGSGSMLDMRALVPHEDRLAIAAYMRALQWSRQASVSDVPPEALRALQAQP